MSLVPADELAKLVREEPSGARDRKEEAPGVDHPAPKTAPDENELRLREAAALRSQVANYEAALRAIAAEAAALETQAQAEAGALESATPAPTTHAPTPWTARPCAMSRLYAVSPMYIPSAGPQARDHPLASHPRRGQVHMCMKHMHFPA